MPKYCFQHQAFWIHNSDSASVKLGEPVKHPLIDAMQLHSSEDTTYHLNIGINKFPYLKDHCVFEQVIFPGAGFVDLFLASIDDNSIITDILLEQPLSLSKEPCRMEIMCTEKNQLSLCGYKNSKWQEYVRAKIDQRHDSIDIKSLEALQERCNQEIDVKQFYLTLFK